MFFTGGNKTVEDESIFADVRVDQERDFAVEFTERGVSGKRHLNEVPYAAHVYDNLIRPPVREPPAKLSNHRSPVLPQRQPVSTRAGVRLQSGEK
jgi:hypothetical protein